MTDLAALAKIVAAAEDLPDDGMMNMQKLLDAVAFAALRVEARVHRRTVDPAERLTEIRERVAKLSGDVATSALREVFDRAFAHYDQDPSGDLPYSVAPDVFVCRSCGHPVVSEAPEYCPICGASSGVFRRFSGMFNGDNAAPPDPGDLFDMLDENARTVAGLLGGLDEADCAARPFPKRWRLRDHVSHLADAQGVLVGRLDVILRGGEPRLDTAVPYVTALNDSGRPAETREMYESYAAQRRTLTDRLRGLSAAELRMIGHHEDFGPVTVMHQVKYFAHHEHAHFGTMRELREAVISG